MTRSPSRNLADLLVTRSKIQADNIAEDAVGGGVTSYANIAALVAVAAPVSGDLALVQDTNKIFVYNGSGWFLIATVNNETPSSISGVNGTYILSSEGIPTTITAIATDPEGFPLTWSYAITSGSLGTTATVEQTENVFIITPLQTEGNFTISFSATDNINTPTTFVSTFSLSFLSSYGIAPNLLGMNSNNISGIAVSESGNSVFLVGYDGAQNIYKWNLTTNFKLDTIRPLGAATVTPSQTLAMPENTPVGYWMSTNSTKDPTGAGKRMYLFGYGGAYTAILNTPYDFSSSPGWNARQIFNDGTHRFGLIFGATMSNSANRFYLSCTTTPGLIYQWSFNNYDLLQCDREGEWRASTNYIFGMCFNNAENRFLTGENSSVLREYSCASDARGPNILNGNSSFLGDINLTSALINTYDLTGASGEVRGLQFSADDTRLYVALRGAGIVELLLNTPGTILDGFVI